MAPDEPNGRHPHLLTQHLVSSLSVIAAVGLTGLGAQCTVSLPASEVPFTLQTLAVVATALILGPGRGALTMAIYLLLGAAGLPLFSDGGSGVAALTGPTGGFLIGFFIAQGAVLITSRETFRGRLISALGCHAVLLTVGGTWLGLFKDWTMTETLGVLTPFFLGAAIKSLGAASLAQLWATWAEPSTSPHP
jgi:biotin transport system substrate-specific component